MNWPVHADSVDFDRLGGAAIAGSAHPPTQIWVPRRAESTASLAAELNAGNRQGSFAKFGRFAIFNDGCYVQINRESYYVQLSQSDILHETILSYTKQPIP